MLITHLLLLSPHSLIIRQVLVGWLGVETLTRNFVVVGARDMMIILP
jgi:hypothetical protein